MSDITSRVTVPTVINSGQTFQLFRRALTLSQILANTAVSIGITAVGTTLPGSDLSVFIYS
jgi:hypothetical protein